jgi:hypothetical protein
MKTFTVEKLETGDWKVTGDKIRYLPSKKKSWSIISKDALPKGVLKYRVTVEILEGEIV